MSHKVSRRTALLGAGAALFALAACGGDKKSDKGTDYSDSKAGSMDKYGAGDQFKATEALSFTMLYSNHPNYPMKTDWLFWSELAKRTGVSIQPTIVPSSDYEQKRSLLIGAGNAPLIIPKTYPGSEASFVASGAILPVSDYLGLMPNLKDKISKWKLEADMDSLRQDDGKYYLLPGVHEDVWLDYSLAIRTDVLAQLNLAVPKTWDELHTVLTAIKAAHPDSYPLSDRFSHNPPSQPAGNLFGILGAAYGVNTGWNYRNASWDATAKKFIFTGGSDNYKKMLEYLNTLIKEKLLDPESFTQSDDSAVQKFVSGKSFVISANAQMIVNDYRTALTKNVPGATVAKIPVPTGPMGDVKSGTRLENGIMISKKARDGKNFVAMMQFIDWLWYSDKGQEFAKWGVEGTTFTKDTTGKRTLAADVNYVGLNPKGTKFLNKDFGFSNGVFAYGGTTELLQSTFSNEELAFQKEMGAKKALPVPPAHPFTDEEREQATLWETPLKDFVYQTSLQFVLGQKDLGQWNSYLTELKGKNSQQYIDLVNTASKRFQKNHG